MFDLQLELLHSIMPVLHPHMHQSRIIAPHHATLGQQCSHAHSPSNVILESCCVQYADYGEECLIEHRSGQCSMSLSISLAIVRGTDSNGDSHCSFSLLHLHFHVLLLLSCSGSNGHSCNAPSRVLGSPTWMHGVMQGNSGGSRF